MTHHRWLHRSLSLVLLAALSFTPAATQAQTSPSAVQAPPTASIAALDQPSMPTSQTSSAATVGAFDQDHIWSRWSADQYALIQDGDDLWIGSGSGVLRWNTVTNTQRRYTTVDGLPSYRIFAVAVDGMGNRWFGGDGGLSRLDAAEQWTHFTAANSGLHTSNVVGIAVGADGTLWLSHGLPAGSVSRRDRDGTWHWAPNRAVAVSSDYPSSVQTQNVNPLWTVTGAEVWAGYSVYDGVEWIDRTPLLFA